MDNMRRMSFQTSSLPIRGSVYVLCSKAQTPDASPATVRLFS